MQNQKSYKNSHFCLHYTFLIFFNTSRESDKSYMLIMCCISLIQHYKEKKVSSSLYLVAKFRCLIDRPS